MPHISKQKLKKGVAEEISAILTETLLSDRVREKERLSVFRSILTSTEQLMLAKRLAVLFMLEEGQSYYRINRLLNVSVSTIRRLHQAVLLGEYVPLQKAFRNKRGRVTFLEFLEVIVSAGMPSIAGPRANKRLKKLREKVWNSLVT